MNKIITEELTDLIEKYINYDEYKMTYEDLDASNLENLLNTLSLPTEIKDFIWDDLSEEASGWSEIRSIMDILASNEIENKKISQIYSLIHKD